MELESLYTTPSHDEGAEVQLRDPVKPKELLDVWIKVCGVDSKAYRAAHRKMKRNIIEAVREKKELADDEFELIVECSIDWRGIESDGKPVPFSKEAVRTLYENSPAIAQQVDSFILDRRNFIKG